MESVGAWPQPLKEVNRSTVYLQDSVSLNELFNMLHRTHTHPRRSNDSYTSHKASRLIVDFASTRGLEVKYRYLRMVCVTSSVVNIQPAETKILWLCTFATTAKTKWMFVIYRAPSSQVLKRFTAESEQSLCLHFSNHACRTLRECRYLSPFVDILVNNGCDGGTVVSPWQGRGWVQIQPDAQSHRGPCDPSALGTAQACWGKHRPLYPFIHSFIQQ